MDQKILQRAFFIPLPFFMKWLSFKIKNKKSTIFLICLGISAFLWLLIKLSKEYEVTIDFPVIYNNLPKNQILSNQPDSVITVRLSDYGFDLIGLRTLGFIKPVYISVEQMNLKKYKNGLEKRYILTKNLSEELLKRAESAKYFQIINPDSLSLTFVNLATKKVKIDPVIEYSLAPQFQLKNPIQTLPDSIDIFGSQKNINQIDFIKTTKRNYQNINQNIDDEIALDIPDKIATHLQTATIQISVEKFTEASMSIPISKYFIAKEELRIFPREILIKYAVSFENFNRVQAEDFKFTAVSDSLSDGKISIKLEQAPDYIRIIDFSPKMAEYIIIK
mgnify:CR=1 FL=1